MKLNLAIDQGNSSSKIYLFEGTRIVDSCRYEILTVTDILEILNKYNVENGILSSVQDRDDALIEAVKSRCYRFIELTENTPMPLTIRYKTPHTLGHDRIASAIGAMTEAPKENLLIIDAGTAVTFDVVNSRGEFVGGNISAGIEMRFNALHNFTDRLPLVNLDGDIPDVGYDTLTALRSGVALGLVSEIEGCINRISQKMNNLKVFITGGDSHFLVEQIKSPIFEDQNLLAKGLNRILLYNENI